MQRTVAGLSNWRTNTEMTVMESLKRVELCSHQSRAWLNSADRLAYKDSLEALLTRLRPAAAPPPTVEVVAVEAVDVVGDVATAAGTGGVGLDSDIDFLRLGSWTSLPGR